MSIFFSVLLFGLVVYFWFQADYFRTEAEELRRMQEEIIAGPAYSRGAPIRCFRCFKNFTLNECSMFMCPECMHDSGGNLLG